MHMSNQGQNYNNLDRRGNDQTLCIHIHYHFSTGNLLLDIKY